MTSPMSAFSHRADASVPSGGDGADAWHRNVPIKHCVGALDGIKVIDLTQVLSGPFCTQMLADHGADVIKVEPPFGDEANRVGAYPKGDRAQLLTGYFQSVNRNKRGIVLDLKKREAREVLLRLVADADVLVENFRAGVMERFGLGYEILAEVNPRLVYASIRGFGDPRTGRSPYTDWPAFDIVAQAMGGLMSVTGPDVDNPMKVGPGVGDLLPGLMSAYGIVLALFEARRSGRGQFVDVSMVDAVAALCERVIHEYSFSGKVSTPQGNRHPILCPFGVFKAKDGLIAIAAAHQGLWQELCRILGRPELATDPEYASNAGRLKHYDVVFEMIDSFTRARTRAEIAAILGGRVPIGPIYNAADIFSDRHFGVREMLVDVEQPGMDEPVKVPGVPVKLTRTPGRVRHRAPTFGEHTNEVLEAAGYLPEDIERLRAIGAVR